MLLLDGVSSVPSPLRGLFISIHRLPFEDEKGRTARPLICRVEALGFEPPLIYIMVLSETTELLYLRVSNMVLEGGFACPKPPSFQDSKGGLDMNIKKSPTPGPPPTPGTQHVANLLWSFAARALAGQGPHGQCHRKTVCTPLQSIGLN